MRYVRRKGNKFPGLGSPRPDVIRARPRALRRGPIERVKREAGALPGRKATAWHQKLTTTVTLTRQARQRLAFRVVVQIGLTCGGSCVNLAPGSGSDGHR